MHEEPSDGQTATGRITPSPTLAITHTSDPLPTSQVPLSSGFDFPVGGLDHEGFDMINCFGCGVDWLGDYGHTAEDYENGREGDPVYAASEGVVLWRGVGPVAYGNVLIVQHNVQGTTVFTLYAHLRDVYAVPGQTVGRRQQIATVGQSGTFMPHLHFEVRNQPMIANRGYTFYPFAGATSIDAYGMTFYSPSWYINNHRHLNSPFGRVDRTKRVPGGFQVSGWAFDPDTSAFIAVHVYVDGQLVSIVAASEERPDVGATFPGRGTAHGFSANAGAGAGNHSFCAYAINAGPGSNAAISCGSFYVDGNPVGALDSAAADASGRLQLSGWALDPDVAAPIDVHVYVNGRLSAMTSASGQRGDILAAYHDYGSQHGFSVS
ncbi:MAG: M23 family metallopeptidase, partial [Thermoleophilia bacterium]